MILVGADGEAGEPEFGYTVGLTHRTGHPELLVSGLSVDLLHSVLNDVARRVMDGRRLNPGDVVEGALSGVPLLVEELHAELVKRLASWSGWFHRATPAAVQLLWPSTSGLFAWQPGATPLLDERQPPGWRRPRVRTGAFAVEPVWPLPVAPETLAFVCKHVAESGDPVRFVSRQPDPERGEDWSVHCGAARHGTKAIRLVHLSHVLRAAPSLREVADLPRGGMAWRDGPDALWQRGEGD